MRLSRNNATRVRRENKKIKIKTSSILFKGASPVAKKLPAMQEPHETQCV